MPDSTVTFKDLALRAVGRTVVNFQRLEHNLKFAARLGPLDGVLAKVQRDLERRTEKASSSTLGKAIGDSSKPASSSLVHSWMEWP
jgi:hypothetical protein